MLLDKVIVGLVFIKRINDIIPIAKGVDIGEVLVEAVAVGVAGDIEPVATPLFAVTR